MKAELEIDQDKLVTLFEIEELEERMEFGKWSGSASGGYSQSEGAHVEATVSMKF